MESVLVLTNILFFPEAGSDSVFFLEYSGKAGHMRNSTSIKKEDDYDFMTELFTQSKNCQMYRYGGMKFELLKRISLV